MKNLKQLLTVMMVMFLSIISAEAVNYPTYKPGTHHRSTVCVVRPQEMTVPFQSTSTMKSSGSTLSMAAQNGATTTYDQEEPSSTSPRGPRRIGTGDSEEFEEDEDGKDTPDPDGPIGAMPWVMMVMMAAGYATWRKRSTMHGNRAA